MGEVNRIIEKWAKSKGVKLQKKEVDRTGKWALVRLVILEDVYRKKGRCSCVPSQRCPCDEMIKDHICECTMYYMPDEMDNRYATKDGIKLTRTEDKYIIEIPRSKK